MQFSKTRLNELKKNFAGKRIAVVGDLMLDGYYWGEVKRISPEAPVPVVDVDNEFFRFGGSANVAFNILKLGGVPFPIGVIGNDSDGEILKGLLKKSSISSNGVIIDKERPTTVKVRVIAKKHHIVRIDKESKQYISAELESKTIDILESRINDIDAIILQDYNKGVLTPNLISRILSLADKHNKIITVDPKFENFFEYKKATVFKPNKKETEDALGKFIVTDEDVHNAGTKLLDELNAEYILLTLGEKGVALFGKDMNGDEIRIPTKARKVADVSGAGDTVISTLTIALSAGADIREAAYLSNFAGGLVCEEIGIVPVELDNLFNNLLKETI